MTAGIRTNSWSPDLFDIVAPRLSYSNVLAGLTKAEVREIRDALNSADLEESVYETAEEVLRALVSEWAAKSWTWDNTYKRAKAALEGRPRP